MDINTLVETILKLNWQTVLGMFAIVWYFTHDIKASIVRLEKKMDKMELRIDSLEERIFLISTGKTLAQAILEDKIHKEENKGKDK